MSCGPIINVENTHLNVHNLEYNIIEYDKVKWIK